MAWTVTRTAPLDTAENIALNPTFTWTKAGTGEESRVRFVLSRNSNLADPLISTYIATALFFELTEFLLDPNATYYWSVNIDETGEALQPAWSFVTEYAAPRTNLPLTGANDVDLQPTLEWEATDGSTKFDVQLALAYDFTGTEGVDLWTYTEITAFSLSILTNLPSSSTIYWRVRAVNTAYTVLGIWSSGDTFNTTYGVPGSPILTSPENVATGISLTELLTWSNGGGAVSYNLYIDTVNTFPSSPVAQNITATSFRIASGTLANNTLYYWKVVANNSAGTADSVTRSFTTLGIAIPDKPKLISPPNLTGILTNIPTFTWGAITGATKYHIQIATDSAFASIVEQNIAVTSTNYTVITPLDLVSVYYWRVRAFNSSAGGSWSDVWSFSTPASAKPKNPVWVYPIVGTVDVSVTPTLDWTDTSNTDAYQLEIATDLNYSNIIFGTSIPLASGSEYTVGNSAGLEFGTVYYARVRSINATSESSWVGTSFKTEEVLAQTIPVVTYPDMGEVDVPLTFLATWTFAESLYTAVTYDVQVSSSPDFGTLTVDKHNVQGKETYCTILQTSYVWFIRVRAITSSGNTGWSVVNRFERINTTVPDQPIIIYPSHGDTDVDVPTFIDWTGNSYNTESYQIQIATDIGMSNLVVNEEGIEITSFITNDLEYSTQYFVRVRGFSEFSDEGYGVWSSVIAFETNNDILPELVQLIWPANSTIDVSVTPKLSWSEANYATSYQVQISLDTDFENHSTNIYSAGGVTDLFFVVPSSTLETKTKYYWRVRGKNHMGYSPEWMYFEFTTEDDEEPTKVILTSPENYTGFAPIAPTFKWEDTGKSSAVKYELHISEEEDFSVLAYDSGTIFAKEFDYNNRDDGSPDTNNPLNYYGRYYWRVRGINDSGANGPWSDPFIFSVRDIPAPLKPVIIQPTYGQVMPKVVNVTFEEPLFADRYIVAVDKHGAFASPEIVASESGSAGNSFELEYSKTYFLRVSGIGQGGFGEASEETYFKVEDSPTSIPSNMDLLVKAQFNADAAFLSLTDLIASDYNTTHGLPLADIKGLFKITGPNGIIYENPGYAADDFSAVDIDGSIPKWVTAAIALPKDVDGNVLFGTYTVEYKLSTDGGGNTDFTFSETYSHIAVTPTAKLIPSIIIAQSYMVIMDSTIYDIVVGGVSYSPIADVDTTRSLAVRWPVGSGQSDMSTTDASIQVGPNLWSGQYDISLTTDVSYALPGTGDLSVELVDQVNGVNTDVDIQTDDCTTTVQSCLTTLAAAYEQAKENNLPEAQTMKKNLDDIMLYYDLYKMAISTGSDPTPSCTKLRELLADCGCLNTGDTSLVSKEIPPVEQKSTRIDIPVTEPAGEDTFELPFVLTLNSIIMVDGTTLLTSYYTGFGTTTLVLSYTLSQYQTLTAIS